jgi:PAS domain S-box-containing protein
VWVIRSDRAIPQALSPLDTRSMGGGRQDPSGFDASALLARVAKILARGESEPDSLCAVAAELGTALADRCTIAIVSRDPSGAEHLRRYPHPPAGERSSEEPRVLADEQLGRRVIEYGTPVTAGAGDSTGGSPKLASPEVDRALRTWLELSGCAGAIAVPVPGSDGPVGALTVGWVDGGSPLGETTPRLLERVAALLAQHHAAATPMGVVSLEGHFVRVNRALASVLGRGRDELMELGPLAVIHPADHDRMVAMIGLLRAGSIRKTKFRQRWLPGDGVPVEGLVSGSVIQGDDGAPCAFAFTLERRSSVAGPQSEWDSLFTHSRQGIAVIGSDGRYARVNDTYAAILGYARSELQGVPWLRTFPADCAAELELEYAEMLRQGSASLETLACRRDGSCFEAELELVVNDDLDGGPKGHLCLMRDIGERKGEELRRSELLRLSSLEHEGADLEALIDHAMRTVREVLQAELASFFVPVADGRELRLRAGVGWPRPQLGSTLAGRTDTPLGSTLASGAPVISADLASDLRFIASPLLAEAGARGSATVLVGDPSAPIGILGAHSRQPREFRPVEVRFLEAVSSLLASVARRERAERPVDRGQDDPVTDLPDATRFAGRLERALSRPGDSTLAVLVVGVELPRGLLGRPTRNAAADVLRETASRIVARLGPGGFAGRLGDRSFGMVLSETDELKAAAVARSLLRAMAEPFFAGGSEQTVHATVGIAVTTHAEDPCELIDEADCARRRGRQLGSDRLEFFDAEEAGQDSPGRQLADDLSLALRREELRLRYQPVFNLSDRKIWGVEALLYWEHPSRTVLPPELFLPVARRSGAIVPIGRWVLEQSIGHFMRWNQELDGGSPLRLFVNLSTRELANRSLPDTVADVLGRADMAPEQLALDVPEAALMQAQGAAGRSIAALREIGATIVLDRFGTALSSPSHLVRRPIDMVKLDRSCVAGIADGGPERAVARAVLGMAESAGLSVIACGVETERQAEALVDLGGTHAQGILFAEPMAARAVNKLLRWNVSRARREAS